MKVDLHLFQGGPQHNTLARVSELAHDTSYAWVADYDWTVDTVVGSESGLVARVWRYRSLQTPDDGV